MHPVQFTAENVSPRSRLTTFFRLFLLIPHVILLELWAIVALVAVLIAWFAILFTGNYPRGLFDFVVSFLRYGARVNAYATLLADRFPPFGSGGEYTAELTIERPERLSRLTTFFRFLLVIPAYIVSYLLGLAGGVVAVIQWLVIVITAECPQGLHSFQTMVQRFSNRFYAYGALVTDRYPNFEEGTPPAAAAPPSAWDESRPGESTW